MECEITTDPFRLRTYLKATPGEYDGYPTLDQVRLSGMPMVISPDRAAVASVLCFANYIAGSFAISSSCSPQVSSAIRRWFSPAEVHVLNIDFEPSARTDGDAVVHVTAEGINDCHEESVVVTGNDIVCHVVNEGTGSIATAGHIGIASNAWLLADPDGSTMERILPAVGIAVLFAEDLFANAISIPGADPDSDPAVWRKLQWLLDAAGLGLVETGELGS